MNKKFWYLTKISLNKKIKSKWFIITNLIILLVIVALVNISSIIEFFGGDFEDNTNIIVVDNTTSSYELLAENIKTFSDENNITIEKSTENIEELEKTIEDNELIVILNSDTNKYLKAEIISNNKIDNLTYQLILQALNNTKTTIGMLASNIDPNILQNIQQNIEVERTILNEELSTDENTDLIMSSVFPTLILPFFMLIIFLVQMVGGEICEEKTTRSMEIIISNVSPKMHLMSKILASNLFVIIQGLLLVVYAIIAFIISKYLGNSLLDASINNCIICCLFFSSRNTSINDCQY